jgi:CarboxypepD_reg-like domain/Dockerin type I domain
MTPLRWLLVVSLAVLLYPTTAWAASGDIDQDGKLTQDDVLLLEAYLKGTKILTDEQIFAADVNADKKINDRDIQVLRASLGGVKNKPGSQVRLDSAYSGQVIDQKTGEPIPNVEIEVPEDGIKVKTDDFGRFSLPKSVGSQRILTARAQNYAPFSVTVARQEQKFDVQLKQLSSQLVVLTDQVHHLGDDRFSKDYSANATQFRIPAQGSSFKKTFDIDRIPDQDPVLRIGSLIGVDTPESVRAGQSRLLLQATFQGSPEAAFRVYLNGNLAQRILLNGDGLEVPLPRWMLQQGANTIEIITAQAYGGGGQSILSVSGTSGIFTISQGGTGFVDYDDIEFANLVLELPIRQQADAFRANNRSGQPR